MLQAMLRLPHALDLCRAWLVAVVPSCRCPWQSRWHQAAALHEVWEAHSWWHQVGPHASTRSHERRQRSRKSRRHRDGLSVKPTHHVGPCPSRTSTNHSIVWHRTPALANHATKCPHQAIVWHRTSALAKHTAKCPWHRTSALARHTAKCSCTSHGGTSHPSRHAWERKHWPPHSSTESTSGKNASSLHTAKKATGPCRSWKHVLEHRWTRHLVGLFELLDFGYHKPEGQIPLITDYSNSLRTTRARRWHHRDVHVAPRLCTYILDRCPTRPDQWTDEL